MIRLSKKFVAVLLAIWLPLFAGNVLAASIAMQSASGDCHAAAPAAGAQHGASMHQHMHQGAHGMHAMQPDHQSSTHDHCGVCQLACSGYLAAVMVEVAMIQLPAVQAMPGDTSFRSFIADPLNPPPLVRA